MLPQSIQLDSISLHMLTIDIAEEDYKIVMDNKDYLQRQHVFGNNGPHSTWPSDTLTLKQNTIDVAWHQKEFQLGYSFAWVIRDKADKYMGCLYLFPNRKEYEQNTFNVHFWLTEQHDQIKNDVFDKILTFFSKEFPLMTLVYA